MRNLIVAAFAAMLSVATLTPAWADAVCKPVPAESMNSVRETYNDPADVAKINVIVGQVGKVDTYILDFDKSKADPVLGMEGIVYGLKNGCVVITNQANEKGLMNVLAQAGVNRKH